MNQLFIRLVLLCAVVVCGTFVVNFKKSTKNNMMVPVKSLNSKVLHSTKTVVTQLPPKLVPPKVDKKIPLNKYNDVILDKYKSDRNLNSLTEIEMQLATCNQQSGLLDVELQNLQNTLAEKKQQNFINCQNKLKQKIGIYKKIYKTIHNVEMTNNEVLELESKIGIESKLE